MFLLQLKQDELVEEEGEETGEEVGLCHSLNGGVNQAVTIWKCTCTDPVSLPVARPAGHS